MASNNSDPIDPQRFKELLQDPSEDARLEIMMESLRPYVPLFERRVVMDFGASFGTSTVALLMLGAKKVIGVEPDGERVEMGHELLAQSAAEEYVDLLHVPDTRSLPFEDGAFPFILAQAVIEHIAQPRELFLREVWRVLAPGGHFLVNETPNKYLPLERHTTGLYFNHWLPRDWAYRRAIRRGRFKPERDDWSSSGWRGVGYYELTRPLDGFELVPENATLKQRVLGAVGLPPSILDPYPVWVFRKPG
jgi:SAM-dependent methyltransferase